MRFLRFLNLLILVFLCIGNVLKAQNELKKNINWNSPINYGLEGNATFQAPNFSEASYDFNASNLPYVYIEISNNGNDELLFASFSETTFANLSDDEKKLVDPSIIKPEIEIFPINGYQKKQMKSFVKFYPFKREKNGSIVKLTSYTLQLNFGKAANRIRNKSLSFATNSLLASGEWYKIAVAKRGVFKLNYNFLKNTGLDVDNLDPRNLKVYAYKGGPLPEANSDYRPDDLMENAIVVVGEQDGRFDKRDYLLFYSEGQVTWAYDTSKGMFRHNVNNYADSCYLFLTVSGGQGKRINKITSPAVSATQVNTYDDYAYHEVDKLNLIKSGQLWLGEVFENQLTYDFRFEFPNIDLSSNVQLEVSAVARAGVVSQMDIIAEGQNFALPIGSTILTRYEVGYGRSARASFNLSPLDDLINLKLTYNKPQSVAKAWLNFIVVNARRQLSMVGNQLFFRDLNSVNSGAYSKYNLTSSQAVRIWDITDQYNIEEMELTEIGNTKSFIRENSILREFVALKGYDSTNIVFKGLVKNQNLHGLSQTDMVIVTHPDFLNEAFELSSFHQGEGLSVHVVTPQQIYNEFSSGAQDPVAIRIFMKMFYDRSTSANDLPKYLLLMGDASYDFKDRINGNTNYVISFQSKNSLEPVESYVSDDYFALLDDNEGLWTPSVNNPELLDIGVGRFPVNSAEMANGIVQKVKAYYSSNAYSDWRNKVTFVGDDQDGVTHMAQSNQLANILETNYKDQNVSKIYLDAFKQISTSTGPRYPQVNEEIRRAVEEGSLFVNYTGHGGETGWAAERVLDISTITNWKNIHNLPLFVTATCEFSRFDDPLRASGGELVLTNPNGGGIGLMTTTRLVYSSPNYYLNQSFYNKVFQRTASGEVKRVGDILMEVKNANASQGNTRNFSLLGDPAVRLAIPKYDVVTTSINGIPISQIDTIKALSKVTITGYLSDENGQKLTNFNGLLYPTVYDKVKDKTTLNNDGGGLFNYKVRDSKIFKGKATVANGDFTFEFVVPKDIAYNFGTGKISYYAKSGLEDGNGYSEDFIIGGSDPNAIVDEIGPEIEVYMNDNSFVYGGITDENPVLIANLSDEQGINTVGNGIGHDLVAILDANTDQSYILNDYYEAETDNYKSGLVTYQLNSLSEGKHTITLKAWDNANNSSEKTIEFNVVSSKEIEIKNLVNYPNPFTTKTEFMFQHNQPGVPLDVKLQVFTVSGKLVKSIDKVVVNEGFLARNIEWNGRDDFGDKIGKGVYVYKIKVRSRNGSIAEKFEKLVIL